jgi:biotin carboxylase
VRALLIVSTRSYRAGAFLEAFSRLGWEAVVASERPQALQILNPSGHLTLDFGDVPGAAHAIARFAEIHPIDFVVGADDDGVMLAAVAAHRLGLRHASAEAVRACRHKGHMRSLLAAAGLPGPRFDRVDLSADPATTARRLFYPCVIKPASLSGSRGVIRADDEAGFVAAFNRVRNIVHSALAEQGTQVGETLLVEEYLEGEEVALEGLLTEGRLRRLAIFDKPDPLRGPYFEETLYVTPSRHPPARVAAVERCVAEAAAAIGLDHGPVHAEVRFDAARATLIEIAPRSIGGLCSRALRFEGGRSLEEVLLRHASGEDAAQFEREPGAAGVLMIPIPRAGTLVGIEGAAEAAAVDGIEDVKLVIPPGQKVAPPPEGGRYLGFVFARAADPAAVEESLREAHRRLQVRIEPESAAAAQSIERTSC